ncbi:MAG: hypothetical protein AAGA29_05920 [Planctomycetota bacterium]
MPNDIERKLTVTDDGSGTLKQAAADADRLSKATDEQARAADKAVSADQRRTQQLDAKRRRLIELQRREIALEEAVESGTVSEREAERVSDRRQRQIERLARSLGREQQAQRRASDAVRESVNAQQQSTSAMQEGAQGAGQLSGGFDGIRNAALGLVAGLVGVNGLRRALAIIRQEMGENTEAAHEFARAFLDLQFLNDSFNDQEKEFIGSAAVAGGRDLLETTRAFTSLKSFFPGQSDQELQDLFLEVVETGRTTSAPLEPLARAFAGLYAQTGDAQVAQNILRATIQQAGSSDPDVIAAVLGKFLGPGQGFGDLNTAQSAGLVAGATGLDTRNPEEQVTGLRTILLRLLGDSADRNQGILDSAGIDNSDFLTALRTLGEAIEQGRISRAELETLVGAEAIVTATALANPENRAALFNKLDAVVAAGDSDEDLTAQAIREQFGNDRAAALSDQLARVRAQAQFQQATDEESEGDLEMEVYRTALRTRLREMGIGPIRRRIADSAFVSSSAVSDDPIVAVNAAITALTVLGQGEDIDDIIRQDAVFHSRETATEALGIEDVSGQSAEDDETDEVSKGGKPTVVVKQQTVINGTQINNSTDPSTGDRELPTGGRR